MVPFSPKDPVIYRKMGLSIHVGDERVVFAVDRPDLALMSLAEESACTVLNTLCHTPVTALGVNFRYAEAPAPDSLLRLFRNPDEADIALSGWDIGSRLVRRSFTRGDLNLVLQFELREDMVAIDANFDFRVPSAESAAAVLTHKTSELSEDLLALLESVYHVSVERANEN